MIGIYKITSPSGKVYIGQSVNIPYRWSDYRSLRCKHQPRLYRSFKYHGVDAHTFEVKEECSLENLNSRERYWQDFYSVTSQRGLNCILQGTDIQKKTVPKNIKTKISKSVQKFNKTKKGRLLIEKRRLRMKGSTRSEKAKQKTSAKLKGMRKGTKLTEDHKSKLSKAKLGKKGALANSSKPVDQFNLSGEFIRSWESIQSAKDSIGPGDIQSCLLGRQKTAGGFIWKYKTT